MNLVIGKTHGTTNNPSYYLYVDVTRGFEMCGLPNKKFFWWKGPINGSRDYDNIPSPKMILPEVIEKYYDDDPQIKRAVDAMGKQGVLIY